MLIRTLSIAAATFAFGALFAGQASAQIQMKASHQFPGGKGDVRDEMVQIIAREVAAANVGLDIKVFPGASLVKANEQWNAMLKGQIDISAFPLDYASGRHPQFGATLMPGLVKSHEHAKRLNTSPFMQDIKKVIEDAGVIVLADAWLAGAFASKKNCILEPADAKGQKVRSAGATFAEMWAGAGASIVSIPSNEVYNALQTGVADGTDTSTGSFVSFRLYEQVSCITAPGDNALWFMYEPVLMSKASFSKLNDKQKAALMAAAKKSEDYFAGESKKLDDEMVAAFTKANVKVVTMTAEQAQKWRDVAATSSYKTFSEKVPGGKELIAKALAVK
ncbi:TRAP transporter substrate-binding protein DctP [Ferrovibrio sp.]|uniref:TRAP transporter substrate-binding protein DctP n=1 Tax=Ferrovibrio sp. TaxID=1917215 RepID=UPI0025C065B3|nr:TRAP transporter substrate-binding protein DctP [Ferrovibrio sp.]MBX3453956.1 TRAP transporter substrate-binding protein DctP [Ferrovibrio sp.]